MTRCFCLVATAASALPLLMLIALAAAPSGAAATSLPPGLLAKDPEGTDVVLTPLQSHNVSLGIGRAEFLRFACGGGAPADAVLSLSTTAYLADPVLLVSLDADAAPRISQNDGSSSSQWREDALGSHYIRAQGVGPRGGIVAVVNTPEFAREALLGELSIRCSPLLAFDLLFWDHLQAEGACPISSGEICSGHGSCTADGGCLCSSGYTGDVCEDGRIEQTLAASGAYEVTVGSGRYQYFKVRVPSRFAGGFLTVEANTSSPFAVLLREGALPSKSRFDACNFEDWVGQSNCTRLRYPVAPTGDVPLGRNLGRVPSRRLWERVGGSPDCSRVEAQSSCQVPSRCKDNCMQCMGCDPSDALCAGACDICRGTECANSFMDCADAERCTGDLTLACEEECGGCIACVDSGDEQCQLRQQECLCCEDCLPVAVKCGMLAAEPGGDLARYVYVGLYNHRILHSETPTASATVRLELFEDLGWQQLPRAGTIDVAKLQQVLEAVADLPTATRADYPSSTSDIYNFRLGEASAMSGELALRTDAMLLLHVGTDARTQNVEIIFEGEPLIAFVLTSAQAAPKTFFDFDMLVAEGAQLAHPVVTVGTHGSKSVWCAVIGRGDGAMRVSVRAASSAPPSSQPPINPAVVGALAAVCVLTLVCFCYARYGSLGSGLMTADPSTSLPFSERLVGLLGSFDHTRDHSMSARGSYGGYVGSDVLHSTIEDRYLQRGGFADDGM